MSMCMYACMCVHVRVHKKLILILYCFISRKYLQLNSSKKSRAAYCVVTVQRLRYHIRLKKSKRGPYNCCYFLTNNLTIQCQISHIPNE